MLRGSEADTEVSNGVMHKIDASCCPTRHRLVSSFIAAALSGGSPRCVWAPPTLSLGVSFPSPMISLSFGTPEHGWLDVELATSDGQRLTMSVSDVPCDSLLHLAESARRIARGWSEEETVVWSLEPAYWHWTWHANDGALELATSAYPVAKPDAAERIAVDTSAFLSAISQSLTALEQNPVWTEDTDLHAWSWPFPTEEVAALRAHLIRAA